MPTSLLAHITVTSATLVRVALDRGRADGGQVDPAEGVDGQPHDLGALVLDEPLDGVEHGVVLDGAGEHDGAVGGRPCGGPSTGP